MGRWCGFITLGGLPATRPLAPPTAGYMGGSWSWCAGLAGLRLGDILLLSLAKTWMGFWAQVVE